MLTYAYKESLFPWRDSLLQPQFVSQLCVVVAVLSDPEFVAAGQHAGVFLSSFPTLAVEICVQRICQFPW